MEKRRTWSLLRVRLGRRREPLLRGVLLLGFVAWIREYLEFARAWIEAHWIPGTVVMVIAVLVYRLAYRTQTKLMED